MYARRQFLVGLGALVLAPACAPKRGPDPFVGFSGQVSEALRRRLTAFERVIREHRWDEALGYFQAEHRGFQHELFFSPDDHDGPRDPGDPGDQRAFRDWYLIETLGLHYVDNYVDSLSEIHRIEYRSVHEPFGADGPLQIDLRVLCTGGRERTGWFFVDRSTLTFFGSVG